MICMWCGKVVPNDSEVCPDCGGVLKATPQSDDQKKADVNEVKATEKKEEVSPKEESNVEDSTEEKQEEIEIEITDGEAFFDDPVPQPKNKKVIAIVATVIVCVLLLAVLLVAFSGKNSFKRAFKGEWYAMDGSIFLILNVDNEIVDYRQEWIKLNIYRPVGQYEWKYIDENTIEVKYPKEEAPVRINVHFSADNNIVEFTPCIIGEDESSIVWYKPGYQELAAAR